MFRIRDPRFGIQKKYHPGFWIRIPDPWGKKAPDLGSSTLLSFHIFCVVLPSLTRLTWQRWRSNCQLTNKFNILTCEQPSEKLETNILSSFCTLAKVNRYFRLVLYCTGILYFRVMGNVIFKLNLLMDTWHFLQLNFESFDDLNKIRALTFF
jgi:hypothetical protein